MSQIVIDKLCVSRGPYPVLRDLTWSVPQGACIGLIGPSGVGKTTLLLSIAGGLYPTSGSVFLNGVPVLDIRARDRGFHLLGQNPVVLGHLTVKENLALPSNFRKINPRIRFDPSEEIASVLELTPLLARRAQNLSGGERQRVAIGQTLLSPAAMLLMDEPLKGALEPEFRMRVRDLIRSETKRRNQTLIFVSHDLDDIGVIADDVACLSTEGIVQQRVDAFFEEPTDIETAVRMGIAVVLIASQDRICGDLRTANGARLRVTAPRPQATSKGRWLVPYRSFAVIDDGDWLLVRKAPGITGVRGVFKHPLGDQLALPITREQGAQLQCGRSYNLTIDGARLRLLSEII